MAAEVRCRCCGIGVTGPRAGFRVCIGCDQCDELHGAKLQGVLALAVRDGKVPVWTAIARQMIDDAQLTGRTVYEVPEQWCSIGQYEAKCAKCGFVVFVGADATIEEHMKACKMGADLTVPNPPPRWLVAAARMVCRREGPDVQTLVDAVLGCYIPGKPTTALLEKMARDLRDALQFIDPEIMDVRVETERDVLEPDHLKIFVQARTPVLGATLAGAAVDLPPDIMSRPRAEA